MPRCLPTRRALVQGMPLWEALLRFAVQQRVDAIIDCGAHLAGISNRCGKGARPGEEGMRLVHALFSCWPGAPSASALQVVMQPLPSSRVAHPPHPHPCPLPRFHTNRQPGTPRFPGCLSPPRPPPAPPCSDAAAFLLPFLDRSRFRGICFFDESLAQWVVCDLHGRCLPRHCSPVREAQALTLFDEARCRGADLQLRQGAVGLLTLGPATAKDKLMQAAGRMRKLGELGMGKMGGLL